MLGGFSDGVPTAWPSDLHSSETDLRLAVVGNRSVWVTQEATVPCSKGAAGAFVSPRRSNWRCKEVVAPGVDEHKGSIRPYTALA
jgi:hypothetical protein